MRGTGVAFVCRGGRTRGSPGHSAELLYPSPIPSVRRGLSEPGSLVERRCRFGLELDLDPLGAMSRETVETSRQHRSRQAEPRILPHSAGTTSALASGKDISAMTSARPSSETPPRSLTGWSASIGATNSSRAGRSSKVKLGSVARPRCAPRLLATRNRTTESICEAGDRRKQRLKGLRCRGLAASCKVSTTC